MKQKTLSRLICLSFAMLLAFSVLQVGGIIGETEVVKTPALNAKVETWTEQNFWDVFWGTGFWQTRTKYTINPSSANTTRTYENRKLLLSTSNDTSLTQSASYSYTSRVGHNFNATVKGKKGHFEAAIGYTLTAETSTTYTANVNVPKHKSIDVWGSDVRVKSQYTTYVTQVQRANNIAATSWVNYGNPSTSKPLIKQYNGKHIDWSYS